MVLRAQVGFPVVIFLFFLNMNRQNRLWIPASSSQEGAVLDTSRNQWFVPEPQMEKDFGFLFMVCWHMLQPAVAWPSVRRFDHPFRSLHRPTSRPSGGGSPRSC